MRKTVVGLDEVGRGALAGPLAVGAFCFINEDTEQLVSQLLQAAGLPVLKDSKQYTASQRQRLLAALEEVRGEAVWALGWAEAAEIDRLGLTAAVRLAAGRALAGLKEQGCLPAGILADAGLRHPLETEVPTEWLVKGDEKIPQISLASVVAKVARDDLMKKIHFQHDKYEFDKNVGYGTLSHRLALAEAGPCMQHRYLFIRGMKQKS